MKHFFRSWGQLWSLCWCPSVWFHGKVVRVLFHLRAQELKHNLGHDVIFIVPEVQTLWPLVRAGLLSSAASVVADYGGGEGSWISAVYRHKERWSLELGFKTKFNQILKALQFCLYLLRKLAFWGWKRGEHELLTVALPQQRQRQKLPEVVSLLP